MTALPRVGFLGTGWIGRHRMQAMVATGAIQAAAIADPSPEMQAEALNAAPGAEIVDGLDGLLALRLDGIVIATPSALHAEQSIRALESGAAVFCQKPLGRTAAEAQAVVDAARAADRLLAVDFSYRFTEGMRRIRELLAAGERVLAISRRSFSLDVSRRYGAAETIPMDGHYRIIEPVKDLTGGVLCYRVLEAVGKQCPLDVAGHLVRERGKPNVAG